MTPKTVKPINKDTTNPKSKVLQETNKSQTKRNKNALDFKKRDLSQVQRTRREPLKNNDLPPFVGQPTDRAVVIEHLSKIRANLSVCNELEIISSQGSNGSLNSH